MHDAALSGHKDAAGLLLAEGADVNAKDEAMGATPLHYAALGGHKDVVELLLAEGADLNAKANDRKTSLLLAYNKGHEDVVKLLLP